MKKCIALLLMLCLLLAGCRTGAPTTPGNVGKPPAPEPPAQQYVPYHTDPSLRQFYADVTYRRDSYPLVGRLNNLYAGWAQGLYDTITANPLTLSKLDAPNLGWIRMAFSTGDGEQVEVFTLYENNLVTVAHPTEGERSCTAPAGTYATVQAYLQGVQQEQSRYFTLSPEHNDDDGYHQASYTLYNAKGKAVVSKQTAAKTATVEMVGEGLVRVTDPDGTRLYEPHAGRKSVLSKGPTDIWGDYWAVSDSQGVYIHTLFGSQPLCRIYAAATEENSDPVRSVRFSADGVNLHLRVRHPTGVLYDRTVAVQQEVEGGVLRMVGSWRDVLTPATEKEEQTTAYDILKKLRHKEKELGFLFSGTLLGHLQVGQTDYLLCEVGHWITAEDGAFSRYEMVGYLMVPSGMYAAYVATAEDNELSWDTHQDWFKK
ncbi:MAG: hypothetical protein IKA50_01740 [Clostridia bacterium]|nr:hypothetical protein [Clostridia bacterium]